MDKVRSWIESTCAVVAQNTGAEEVTLEQAVLFLCEKDMIHEASPDRTAGEISRSGEERSAPATNGDRAKIVYQQCRPCDPSASSARSSKLDRPEK